VIGSPNFISTNSGQKALRLRSAALAASLLVLTGCMSREDACAKFECQGKTVIEPAATETAFYRQMVAQQKANDEAAGQRFLDAIVASGPEMYEVEAKLRSLGLQCQDFAVEQGGAIGDVRFHAPVNTDYLRTWNVNVTAFISITLIADTARSRNNFSEPAVRQICSQSNDLRPISGRDQVLRATFMWDNYIKFSP
jgi:hypothetical protein